MLWGGNCPPLFRYVTCGVYSPIMRLSIQSPKFSEVLLASLPVTLPSDDIRREVDDRSYPILTLIPDGVGVRSQVTASAISDGNTQNLGSLEFLANDYNDQALELSFSSDGWSSASEGRWDVSQLPRPTYMSDVESLLREGSNALATYALPVRRQTLARQRPADRLYQDAGIANVRPTRFLQVVDHIKQAMNVSLRLCSQTSDLVCRVQEDLDRSTSTSERVAISRMVQAALPRGGLTSSSSLLSETYSGLGWPWTDRSSFEFASRVLFTVLGSAPSRRLSNPRYPVAMDIAMSARNAPESWQPVFDSLHTLMPEIQAKVRRMVEIVTLDPWVTDEFHGILSAVDRVISALRCLNRDDVRQMPDYLWLRLRVLLLCELDTSLRNAARNLVGFPQYNPVDDYSWCRLQDVVDSNNDDELVRMLTRGAGRASFRRNLETHLMSPDARIPNFPHTTRDDRSVMIRENSMLVAQQLERRLNDLSLNYIGSPRAARLLLLLTPLALVTPSQMHSLGTEALRCLVNRAHSLSSSYLGYPSFSFSDDAMFYAIADDSDESESERSHERFEFGDHTWTRPFVSTELATDGTQPAEEETRRSCAVCLTDFDESEMKFLRCYKAQWRDRETMNAAELDFSPIRGRLASNYCGHVFHKKCRDSCASPFCPMCRAHWMKAETTEPESAENVEDMINNL